MKKLWNQKRWKNCIGMLFLLFALALMPSGSQKSVLAANRIGYVNHYYLNLREQCTTNSKLLLKLAQNDELEILEDLNGWYKVNATHEGKKYAGYVYAEYVTFVKPVIPTPTPTPSPTPTPKPAAIEYIAYVKTTTLNLRKAPSVSSARVVKLSKNDKIAIDKYSDGWYSVTALHKGKTYKGYVIESYIAFNEPSGQEVIGYVNNDTLNLRSGPGTYYNQILKLSRYDYLIIRDAANGWYRITATHDGARYNGYVSADYVKTGALDLSSATPTGYTNLTKLNLRRAPSTSAAVVVKLDKNDKVYAVANSNGWYKVVAVHGGKNYYGYVVEKYIKKYVPPTSNEKIVYVKNTKLNLRKTASSSGVIVMVLDKNDKLVVKKELSSGWYQVIATHNNSQYTGYVKKEYVKSSVSTPKPTGSVNTASVTLYFSASKTSASVIVLKKNDKVTISSTVGDWYKVIATHGGKQYEGYILKTYVTKD